MNNRNLIIALTSAASLAVVACDSNESEPVVMDDVDSIVVTEEDPYPIAGDMNPDQQSVMDAMDSQAVSDEFDSNADAMNAETASAMDSGGTDSGGNAAAMPARSEMTFGWLDRNDDGQLSVAEYAIWALPTNPNMAEPNDALKPYLTSDQINEAGQTFFYFDDDGSTYLSEGEFADARASGSAAL